MVNRCAKLALIALCAIATHQSSAFQRPMLVPASNVPQQQAPPTKGPMLVPASRVPQQTPPTKGPMVVPASRVPQQPQLQTRPARIPQEQPAKKTRVKKSGRRRERSAQASRSERATKKTRAEKTPSFQDDEREDRFAQEKSGWDRDDNDLGTRDAAQATEDVFSREMDMDEDEAPQKYGRSWDDEDETSYGSSNRDYASSSRYMDDEAVSSGRYSQDMDDQDYGSMEYSGMGSMSSAYDDYE